MEGGGSPQGAEVHGGSREVIMPPGSLVQLLPRTLPLPKRMFVWGACAAHMHLHLPGCCGSAPDSGRCLCRWGCCACRQPPSHPPCAAGGWWGQSLTQPHKHMGSGGRGRTGHGTGEGGDWGQGMERAAGEGHSDKGREHARAGSAPCWCPSPAAGYLPPPPHPRPTPPDNWAGPGPGDNFGGEDLAASQAGQNNILA